MTNPPLLGVTNKVLNTDVLKGRDPFLFYAQDSM